MDYSAFSQKMTKSELDEFERLYPISKRLLHQVRIAIALLAFISIVFVVAAESAVSNPEKSGGGIVTGIVLMGFVVVFLLAIVLTYTGIGRMRRASAMIQLFAQRNGLQYTRNVDNFSYAGIFFNIGSKRSLQNIISSSTANPPFEIGNAQYSVRTGKNEHTFHCGYIKIQLERNLPQIVLMRLKTI